MNATFARECTNALLLLFEEFELLHDQNVTHLRRAQEMNVDSANGLFSVAWRVANAARALADRAEGQLRLALLSTALGGYNHCVPGDSKFARSVSVVSDALRGTEPFPEEKILESFATSLEGRIESGPLATAEAPVPPNGTGAEKAAFDSSYQRFTAPTPATTRVRFESLVSQFSDLSMTARDAAAKASRVFEDTLTSIMRVADAGRTFTEFAPLERDLKELRTQLFQLSPIDDPRVLQDRARTCRAFAEALDFRTASPEDYRYSRLAWLLSLYWNSQLTSYWGANAPQNAYDVAGYLSAIQAEIRYSDADFLLLLRVSFSISRVATHDGLLPLQFVAAAGERLGEWVRYSVGTTLVSAGPGRVPPSRVPYDPRLSDLDRRDFAATLLRSWEDDAERAAAATILLEMSAWSPERAARLLSHVFARDKSNLEIWTRLVAEMATQADRVRVVRPNPWAPGSTKSITVEREAVAMLAADVVNRCYQVIGGNISLRGHEFRERRVPTFVCSAEFGPLGLFKLDTAERVGREVTNFSKYAQRLHPRYRASRCDPSMAVITEPDDAKQFVQGALTSYVFTEDETPTTLNAWFIKATTQEASRLSLELFERALRPWYGYAVPATLDLFEQLPMFNRVAIQRVVDECKEYFGIAIDLKSSDALSTAAAWVASLLDYAENRPDASENAAADSVELQVLRSYRSVCHGDLHLENVLVIGKAESEYPCVIDFEATHEGYVLKDFGRFAASLLFRTYEWSTAEREEMGTALPAVLLDWRSTVDDSVGSTKRLRKVIDALLIARQGILRAWQAGSAPTRLELTATLVASFLPYARYKDTSPTSVDFALRLAGALVNAHRGHAAPIAPGAPAAVAVTSAAAV
jgi:hypothetical protein